MINQELNQKWQITFIILSNTFNTDKNVLVSKLKFLFVVAVSSAFLSEVELTLCENFSLSEKPVYKFKN